RTRRRRRRQRASERLREHRREDQAGASRGPMTADPADFIAAQFVKWRDDPEAFAREFLGFDPWAKQVEVLEAVRDNPRVAVPSAHGVGKSALGGVVAWWWKLCHEPSK